MSGVDYYTIEPQRGTYRRSIYYWVLYSHEDGEPTVIGRFASLELSLSSLDAILAPMQKVYDRLDKLTNTLPETADIYEEICEIMDPLGRILEKTRELGLR